MHQPDVIADYKILGEVGRGASGVVYKVQSPDSQDVFALKLLKATLSEAIVETLRFEREFRLASVCDHPNLVKTHQYGSSNGQPYYTMDLVAGLPFNKRFGNLRQRGELEIFARVVEGILQALEHIHEKRIVHRDLKPENVLVTAEDQPRILDFGLARPQYGDGAPKLTDPGTVVGTVHYLSPEQLSTRPLDGRSDLFSVGTMLYEALAGRLPFDADHPIGVFGQILGREPLPLELPEGYPDGLEALVMKLLSKEPANRFQTASSALAAWRKVMFGIEEEAKVRQVETPEELYMPRFVGQSEALGAFNRVFQSTGPRILFVEGKAGAGKSRFLEEVASLAQARGHVHTGARAGGPESTPYQLWIPPLRQAFKRPQPAMMPMRSILSALLPELGHSKASASSKAQLFECIARVLKLQTGVIWLDDIHLADSASLEFLHYLARRVTPDECLTVVATYNPDLPADLWQRTRDGMLMADFAVSTRLVPLTQSETAAKVESMLAGELDEPSATLLYRETLGNPLYIGEAVKAALAEGRLSNDESGWSLKPPAEKPLTGTVRDQLEMQLNSLEPGEKEALKLASLLGFDFDFEVLAQVSGVPKVELLDTVLKVSDKGFLIEAEDDRFRFGSRALRQVVVESIPRTERTELHRAVAEALEKLHPRNRWVVDIALHYESAGSLEKAVTHLLVAGAEASRNFAHKDALDYYQRALKVPAEKRIAMPDDLILEKIARARQGLGKFGEAKSQYEELLQRATSTVNQVRLRRKIAECEQMLGRFRKAHEHLTKGLDLIGAGTEKNTPKAAPMQWMQKFVQELSSKFSSQDIMSHQLHRILDRQLSNLFFLRPTGWREEVFRLARLQEDVAGKLSNPESLAQAQIFLGFVELHNGHRQQAVQHWEKGLSIASDLRDSPYKALLIRNMGLMHLLAGNAPRAHELCLVTRKISKSLSDGPGMTQVEMVLCAVELHRALFDKALEHAQAMLSTADDVGLPVFKALARSYLARATARNNRLDEAGSHLAAAEKLGQELRLPYVDMLVWIARAWVNCDSARHRECLQTVDEGLAFCERIESLPFYRLTLRCAGIWSSVEEIVQGRPAANGDRDGLREILNTFKEDAAGHGVVQFVGIADQLQERLR